MLFLLLLLLRPPIALRRSSLFLKQFSVPTPNQYPEHESFDALVRTLYTCTREKTREGEMRFFFALLLVVGVYNSSFMQQLTLPRPSVAVILDFTNHSFL